MGQLKMKLIHSTTLCLLALTFTATVLGSQDDYNLPGGYKVGDTIYCNSDHHKRQGIRPNMHGKIVGPYPHDGYVELTFDGVAGRFAMISSQISRLQQGNV